MRDQVSADGTIGFDDVGEGAAVVLLHGFPLTRAMWRPQVEALRADYRVIAPDLRGLGASGGFRGQPSVDQMADDVAALLDELKVAGPVVLGGLSMGGYVALAFARRHAGRLRGLILADTKAEADDAEGKANRDLLIAFAARNTGGAVLEQMLPRLVSADTPARRPEVVESLRRMAAGQTSAGIIGALEAMRDRPDSGPSLAAIAVPTLVVVGEQDAITPPAVAQSLASRVRGAKLVTIPDAGHVSNLEQPDRFSAAVRSFLGGLG